MPLGTRTRHLLTRFRHDGFSWLVSAVFNRVLPPRLAMRPAVLSAVSNRTGLEIGGPSRVFATRGMLPVYERARRINNVNFSTKTTWETSLYDGGKFQFDSSRAPGTQFIRDATELTGLADASYDFILSSHCLEHVANPLRALREWHRVTRPGGHLVLLVPDPARSFDHRRPVTTLAHLRADYEHGVGENDETHMVEILELHDLGRDPHAGTWEQFRERSRHNEANRCLHHHVFDLNLLKAAVTEMGWHVLAAETARPVHLVVFAGKIGSLSAVAAPDPPLELDFPSSTGFQRLNKRHGVPRRRS
jgi:SAM-dependent methyltransferase